MPDRRKNPSNRGLSYKKIMVSFRPGPYTMRQLVFLADKRRELFPDSEMGVTESIVFSVGYAARQLGWSNSKPRPPSELLKSNQDIKKKTKRKASSSVQSRRRAKAA